MAELRGVVAAKGETTEEHKRAEERLKSEVAELMAALSAREAITVEIAAECREAGQEVERLRAEVAALRGELAAKGEATEEYRRAEERLKSEAAELKAALSAEGEGCRVLEEEIRALRARVESKGESEVATSVARGEAGKGVGVGVPPKAAVRLEELENEALAWECCTSAWEIDLARQTQFFRVRRITARLDKVRVKSVACS
jgi:predicted  nucleic acid-binding Zn-ribbon protein